MLDYETRQRIKEAVDKRQRLLLRDEGIRLAEKSRTDYKAKNREKHRRKCVGKCGRLALHPPYGTGRCLTCAQNNIPIPA